MTMTKKYAILIIERKDMLRLVLYIMMVVGYLGVSLDMPGIKMKLVGILLTIVNAILFYK